MARAVFLSVLCVLLAGFGCGGQSPTASTPTGDFPVIRSGCQQNPTAVYMIMGLSTRVSSPGAPPPLVANVRVGEAIRLRIDLTGCGPVPYQSSWVSTNPAVATVSPDPQYGSFVAELRALAEGETTVYADAKLRDLADLRVHVAYCGSDFGACASPVRIGRVVVAR